MGIRPLLPTLYWDQGVLRLDIPEDEETELARIEGVTTEAGDEVKLDAMAQVRLDPDGDDETTYRIRLRLYRNGTPLVQGDVAANFELGNDIAIRELPVLTWVDVPGPGTWDYVLQIIVEDLMNIQDVTVFEVALNAIVFPEPLL